MNNSENNFTELKQLLKLKRHELPPPGYFNHLSGEVVARIRAGEAGAGQTLNERVHAQAPWLASFLEIFQTKPGLVGAFATSLCLLLMFGAVLTERNDFTPEVMLADSEVNGTAANSLNAIAAPGLALSAPEQSGISVSTNFASLRPTPTLFGQQNPLFQSASFAPAGN